MVLRHCCKQIKCRFCRRERAAPCPGQHRVPSEYQMPSTRAPEPARSRSSWAPALTSKPHTNRCRSALKHGLLLFTFQGKLYHYRVCHFGGCFSAFWWQRTGAFCMGCWLGSPTKPSFLSTTFCVHSSEIARQICLPWWCFSFAPLRRQFHGKRRSSRTALFGAAGRSTSPTTPFSSCPLS